MQKNLYYYTFSWIYLRNAKEFIGLGENLLIFLDRFTEEQREKFSRLN